MTAQEALNLLNDTEFAEKHQGKEEYTDMLLMCKEALEKQIPKKVDVQTEDDREFIDYICLCCKTTLQQKMKIAKRITIHKSKCCDECGQALDWSDTE